MKKSVLITISLTIALAVYLLKSIDLTSPPLIAEQSEMLREKSLSDIPQPKKPLREPLQNEEKSTNKTLEGYQVKQKKQRFSDLEIEEIHQWLQSKGFFYSDKELYDSYDLDTLEQLAKQGDEIALYLLPSRYSKLYFDTKAIDADLLTKREEALRKAAILGSGYAIQRIAGDLTRQGIPRSGAGQEIQRDLMKQGFSYLLVAEMRGWGLATVERMRLETELEAPWSAEEQQEIEAMAQVTYREFEQEREKLGLDPFDNSVPELVEQYYGAIIERSK